jgi:hypothetical protein
MRFLLRMAFWLTVILALLPSGGSQPTPTINVSALEAMSAAKATVTDMGSFCGRQPDACSVGSQAAVAIGHRAQAGAKMLYDYFNEHFGSQDAGTTANAANGTALPLPTPRPSQHTLSPADLAPGWRGPQSRKETHDGSTALSGPTACIDQRVQAGPFFSDGCSRTISSFLYIR